MAQTHPGAVSAPGLTTNQAPFIEGARARGELYISQPYELYSEENHEAWRRLYQRMQPRWEHYANDRFLKGIHSLSLPADRVPRLEEVNRFLRPLTGFQAKPVSGYVPAFLFFDCLRRREFPTTVTIRPADKLDYLPEPDIFHDIGGHVPMHTDRAFADTLVRFGECARTAVEMAASVQEEAEKSRRLASNIKALARAFWFTVEFGLMRCCRGICAYGSGLLSSYGELQHAVESSQVQRFPFQLEWAINQQFEIDHYQPLLFVIESFDHLFIEVSRLEKWIREGKLDNVAPGEPAVNEADLRSFLEAETR